MKHYAEPDVSVKETSVCIVDEAGEICREVIFPSPACPRPGAPVISPAPKIPFGPRPCFNTQTRSPGLAIFMGGHLRPLEAVIRGSIAYFSGPEVVPKKGQTRVLGERW